MTYHKQKLLALREHGFSLIESLVTVVVLSIGMLGIAALYVESLKAGQTASIRMRAVVLAADMADRIRANPLGATSYTAGADAAGNAPAKACAETNLVLAQDCTPAELAAFDIWEWKTLTGNTSNAAFKKIGLPTATAVINRNPGTTPTTYTIVIGWSEKDDELSYSLSVAI